MRDSDDFNEQYKALELRSLLKARGAWMDPRIKFKFFSSPTLMVSSSSFFSTTFLLNPHLHHVMALHFYQHCAVHSCARCLNQPCATREEVHFTSIPARACRRPCNYSSSHRSPSEQSAHWLREIDGCLSSHISELRQTFVKGGGPLDIRPC
jgi:hypothetical protein